MTDQELANEGARGLVETGVEGAFDAVSCSTAGDYPSMGCSQWEGPRGDLLLSYIDGGDHFSGRSYSDIQGSGELSALSELLGSEQGQAAQLMLLADDCLQMYMPALGKVPKFWDSRCIIYALLWCPTSHNVVRRFLQNRNDDYDLSDLAVLRDLFATQYATAAACEEYAEGYANRAENIFNYVSSLDLSAYGVQAYEG